MKNLTDEQISNIRSLKDMIKSCYAYEDYKKDGYNYSRYIKPYKDKLGEQLFNLIYEQHVAYLEKTFRVIKCTYSDDEGLTYNSLQKIK